MALKEKPMKKFWIHLVLITASIMSIYPIFRVVATAVNPSNSLPSTLFLPQKKYTEVLDGKEVLNLQLDGKVVVAEQSLKEKTVEGFVLDSKLYDQKIEEYRQEDKAFVEEVVQEKEEEAKVEESSKESSEELENDEMSEETLDLEKENVNEEQVQAEKKEEAVEELEPTKMRITKLEFDEGKITKKTLTVSKDFYKELTAGAEVVKVADKSKTVMSFESFNQVLFVKGYDGGSARKEERIILKIIQQINQNSIAEFRAGYEADIAKKQSEDGKLTSDKKKEYKMYKSNWDLEEAALSLKIEELKSLQEKTWYKFFNASFWIWFKNSMIVSFFTVLFGVSFAATAGYAFSRFNFPGKNSGLTFFLITQMFPPTMLLLPMYLVMARIGLVNTYLGLVIMYTTTALPLCVWQMKGYYDTIPYTLEEAALIDGCSPFSAFYRIILPLVKPGIVVTALFSFMASWTDFVVANVMMQKEALKTLPLGLQSMNGRYYVEWANFSAASILVMIPAILLFIYLSKFLVSGLTLGGVKE